VAGVAAATAPSVDSYGKYHFLVRRLHSLSGLVPIGVFVVIHLLTNSTILLGGEEFQRSVDRIHALGPLLFPVEVAFIFLPLAFHAVVGIAIWMTSSPNASDYRYGANIRYTLQRVTGGIALLFILYHVWEMHWFGDWAYGGKFEVEQAATSAAGAIQRSPWIAPFYAIGVVATVYHLANGIWTALITWGITIRPRSQQISGYVCATFGVILSLVGLGALTGFKNLSVSGSSAERAESTHVLRTIDQEPHE
jgi:succinate dehydrogenase / fumarate reductase cytochrome b subunit